MQTLRIGRGITAIWEVTLRDGAGRVVEDTYDGSEPLSLVICDLDGEPLDLLASTVAWGAEDGELSAEEAAAAGLVLLLLDNSDTATMGAGPRGLSILLTIDGEPYEAYGATLRVEPR